MRPVARGQLWHHYEWGLLRVVGVFVAGTGTAKVRISAVSGGVQDWASPLAAPAEEFRGAVSRGELVFVRGPEAAVSDAWPTDYEEAKSLLQRAAREFYLQGGKSQELRQYTRRTKVLSEPEHRESDRAQYLRTNN